MRSVLAVRAVAVALRPRVHGGPQLDGLDGGREQRVELAQSAQGRARDEEPLARRRFEVDGRGDGEGEEAHVVGVCGERVGVVGQRARGAPDPAEELAYSGGDGLHRLRRLGRVVVVAHLAHVVEARGLGEAS
jgi:hypothetical protein